jgi:hypothetical protein
MSNTLYTILLILLALICVGLTLEIIQLFFRGMLFLIIHPIQSIIFLIVFWLIVKILKSIIC